MRFAGPLPSRLGHARHDCHPPSIAQSSIHINANSSQRQVCSLGCAEAVVLEGQKQGPIHTHHSSWEQKLLDSPRSAAKNALCITMMFLVIKSGRLCDPALDCRRLRRCGKWSRGGAGWSRWSCAAFASPWPTSLRPSAAADATSPSCTFSPMSATMSGADPS